MTRFPGGADILVCPRPNVPPTNPRTGCTAKPSGLPVAFASTQPSLARQSPSSFSRERPKSHSAPPPQPLVGEGRDEGRFVFLVGLASASEIPESLATTDFPNAPAVARGFAPHSPLSRATGKPSGLPVVFAPQPNAPNLSGGADILVCLAPNLFAIARAFTPNPPTPTQL